jgi:phage shock protein C
MIAGICAGFAEYLDVDASLLRLIVVVLALVTVVFPVGLFYIIAWIIIPSENSIVVEKDTKKTKKNNP